VKIWDQPWKKLRSVTQKTCKTIENSVQNNLPNLETNVKKVLGGDGHDQVPHGHVLGGDGHDQMPHRRVLGGDEHDQVPHGHILGGDGHDQMPHRRVLGGDEHDQVPHGHILGGDGDDQVPHGHILGGDGHDQVPHGRDGLTESFDSDPDIGLERHNIHKKVLVSSNPVEPQMAVKILDEEFMPLLNKPSKY